MAGIAMNKNSVLMYIDTFENISKCTSRETEKTLLFNSLTAGKNDKGETVTGAYQLTTGVSNDHRIGQINQIGEIGGECEEVDKGTFDNPLDSENGLSESSTTDVTIYYDSKNDISKFEKWKDDSTDLVVGAILRNKNCVPIVWLAQRAQVKGVTISGASVSGVASMVVTLRWSGKQVDYNDGSTERLADETAEG